MGADRWTSECVRRLGRHRGTLAGTSLFLKEKNPESPSFAPILMARRCGRGSPTATRNDDGDSFAEGIGQGRVTKNLEGIAVDKPVAVDQAALTIVYQLLHEEGFFSAFPAASTSPAR